MLPTDLVDCIPQSCTQVQMLGPDPTHGQSIIDKKSQSIRSNLTIIILIIILNYMKLI